MTAASALLEKTGGEEAVTLRAAAREVGIAAPSTSQHFPDRDVVLDAVVVAAFEDLIAALEHDRAPVTDARERLLRGWGTYVHFAQQHLQRYRVMFGRGGRGHAPVPRGMPPRNARGADAVALWASVRGLATLGCTTAAGWPDQGRLLGVLVERGWPG